MKNIFIFSLFISTCCMSQTNYKTIGSVEKFDDAIDKIVSKNAKAEIIAEGFDWSEGALWIEQYKMLLFSDVPQNTIYKWTEAKGKRFISNHPATQVQLSVVVKWEAMA